MKAKGSGAKIAGMKMVNNFCGMKMANKVGEIKLDRRKGESLIVYSPKFDENSNPCIDDIYIKVNKIGVDRKGDNYTEISVVAKKHVKIWRCESTWVQSGEKRNQCMEDFLNKKGWGE